MPKGYWIGHVDVSDPEIYAKYREANAAPFAEYGAKFLVRGGGQDVMEGEVKPRTVVIEFESYAKALECYHSEGYRAAKAIRDPISSGDMVIVEGYDD